MAESIWVGRDEHEGVRAQPRKDVKPPPNWRLEAIAQTPRPRSLHVVGGRAVFIEDGGDTSDVWLLDLEDGAVPRRLTTGREPMPYVNRRASATTGAWPGTQTFCGWKSSGSTGKGGLGPYYLAQFMREQSRTVVG